MLPPPQLLFAEGERQHRLTRSASAGSAPPRQRAGSRGADESALSQMGQAFSLPQLLGMTDVAPLDTFEPDLLLYIVRMLIRDEPAAIGRLICCCRTLVQLTCTDTQCEELRKARRIVARRWLFDLRLLAGRMPAGLPPLITQISRQLSFRALRPEIDEPLELDLSRWARQRVPDPRHSAPTRDTADAEWVARGTALKRVLYASESLTSADFSVCYLTHMDAVEIAEGLKTNRSLATLNASGNFFGGFGRDGRFIWAPEGVAALADALSVSKLTTLSLAENRLGPEGMKLLAPGLALTSLTNLDVSRNGIGVEGATQLAAGLAVNHSLLKLDVRLNKLGPAGAKALAPGVAANASLTALDLRFNGVGKGDEGEAALNEAAKGRRGFCLMVCNVSE